jgi:adenosylcobinamide-GDP ribazoletransferase
MWNSFALALRILTAVPSAAIGPSDRSDFKRAVILFPFVGAILGAVSGAVWMVGARLWTNDPLIIAAVTVLADLALTGARGISGTGRAADAMASIQDDGDRAKALALLRDARRNGSGIAAIAAGIVVKTALLSGLRPDNAWQILIVAGCLGQWGTAFAFTIFRILPAWNNEGEDADLNSRPAGLGEFMPAMMLAILGAALVPIRGVIALSMVALVAGTAGKSIDRQFGGMNIYFAHALGAAAEVVALAVLLIKL